jgi:hypothetical protein
MARIPAILALALCLVSCTSSDDAPSAVPNEADDIECTNERKCSGSEVCILGHCQAGAMSCQASRVTCADATPECAQGFVPSVVDGCWGACTSAELCWALDDCTGCEQAGLLCVELPLPFDSFFVCSQRDVSQCTPLSCACLGAVCGGELACASVSNQTVKCVPGLDGSGAAGMEAGGY